jgi:peptidoglycan hydrolase-like protein with peptidoglycan-binding domain
MTVVCPFALWKPVRNHGGGMGAHLGLVLHVQAGNGGLSGWFNNPAAQASSTWWVSKSGVLEQYVDANLCAWAQSSGNGSYNSVETEGYPNEPLTPQQEAQLARLYQWGAGTYRWPKQVSDSVGRPGFAWHGMGGAAWGGHPSCPGDLRKNRRQAILNTIGAPSAPPPPKPAPPPPPSSKVPPLHVDYFGRSHNATVPDVRTWQTQMKNRGWTIGVDQNYGPQSESVCIAFQKEKHLTVDGKVGPQTWATSFTAPVT